MLITKKYNKKLGISVMLEFLSEKIIGRKKENESKDPVWNLFGVMDYIIQNASPTEGRFNKFIDLLSLELELDFSEKTLDKIVNDAFDDDFKRIRFYEILMTIMHLGIKFVDLREEIKIHLKKLIGKLVNSGDQYGIKMYLHAENETEYPYYAGYVRDMSKILPKIDGTDYKKNYLNKKDNPGRASVLAQMFLEIEDRFKDSDISNINSELSRILNKYNIRHGDKENKSNIAKLENFFGENSNEILRLHYDRCYILLTMKHIEIKTEFKQQKAKNQNEK